MVHFARRNQLLCEYFRAVRRLHQLTSLLVVCFEKQQHDLFSATHESVKEARADCQTAHNALDEYCKAHAYAFYCEETN